MRIQALGAAAAACLFAGAVSAENWPQWRGPSANGVSGEKGLPTAWGPEENVAWKVELPGWGASTPAVWGDHVFVTSQDDDDFLWLLCVDRAAGKLEWKRQVAKGRVHTHRLHNCASPSPVTDGRHVWVQFATGDLACFDFSGESVWQRNLADDYGEYSIKWGIASSPALHDDQLFIACMNEGMAYVLALDKKSGKQLWRIDRPTDARGESRDSYSTPVVYQRDGKPELLVTGASLVTAYDPANGKPRWTCGGITGRVVATPVVADKLIVASSAFSRGMMGIRPGGLGDVTKSHVQWNYPRGTPDVPTPIVYRDLVFWVSDRGIAVCVDARTGEEVWKERVGGQFWSSPVAAEGRLYCVNEAGETLVLAADRTFKKIASNSIGEGDCMASPAISDGQIVLRSRRHLFVIGTRRGS